MGKRIRAVSFKLGRIVTTVKALAILNQEDVLSSLRRHSRGDWGQCGEHDSRENDAAVDGGFRLLSVYADRFGEKFWIITEADRTVTTVLLPEEY